MKGEYQKKYCKNESIKVVKKEKTKKE